MAKQFLKINSLSNDDGNDLFNAICKDILHKKSNEVRIALALPPAQRVTTKDVVTLIQECGLECYLSVSFDPEVTVEFGQKGEVKEDEKLPF